MGMHTVVLCRSVYGFYQGYCSGDYKGDYEG